MNFLSSMRTTIQESFIFGTLTATVFVAKFPSLIFTFQRDRLSRITLIRVRARQSGTKKGWTGAETSSVIPLHPAVVALVTNNGFVPGRQWLLDFRALQSAVWLNGTSPYELSICDVISSYFETNILLFEIYFFSNLRILCFY